MNRRIKRKKAKVIVSEYEQEFIELTEYTSSFCQEDINNGAVGESVFARIDEIEDILFHALTTLHKHKEDNQ